MMKQEMRVKATSTEQFTFQILIGEVRKLDNSHFSTSARKIEKDWRELRNMICDVIK